MQRSHIVGQRVVQTIARQVTVRAMAATANNLKLVRWLTCLMFFTFAMTTDAVGSVIPKVIEEFALSLTAAGSFHYSTMVGIGAGALLLGFLADRAGRKVTIILGLTLYSLS